MDQLNSFVAPRASGGEREKNEEEEDYNRLTLSVAAARQGQRAVRSKTFCIFLLLLVFLLLRDVPGTMTVGFAHFLAAAAAAVTSTTGNYRVDVWVCVYIYIYIYK